jgi:acetyl esterase/lipase
MRRACLDGSMKALRLRHLAMILAFLLTSLAVNALTSTSAPPVEPQTISLWPDGSPNNPVGEPRPNLMIYRPFAPTRSDSATIIIVPGGGFNVLSPYEHLLAEYLRSLGYTAVVVNYRLKPHRYPEPFADVLRAVRLVRRNADEWHLPSRHVALLGGSAGGYLAALAATRPDAYRDPQDDLADKVSARPDRLILLYPVISTLASYKHHSLDNWFTDEAQRPAVSPERHVSKDNPPAIIFHAADDTTVLPENSIDFARACWAAGVPAELHIFPRGGHGRVFAYDAEVSPRWRAILQDWLANWRD